MNYWLKTYYNRNDREYFVPQLINFDLWEEIEVVFDFEKGYFLKFRKSEISKEIYPGPGRHHWLKKEDWDEFIDFIQNILPAFNPIDLNELRIT